MAKKRGRPSKKFLKKSQTKIPKKHRVPLYECCGKKATYRYTSEAGNRFFRCEVCHSLIELLP
jgi:hypothetical protein